MRAHHYLSASEYARSAGQAIPELERETRRALADAGERAFALGAHPTAARYFEAALEHCPPGVPERPWLQLQIGRARPDDRTLDDAVLEEAAEGLLAMGEREAAAEAHALLALNWWVRGSGEPARRHVDRAESLLSGDAVTAERTQVLSTVARVAMLAGDFERATEVGAEALRLADALGRGDLRARIMITVGTARASAGERGGIAELERGIELAAEVGLVNLQWKGLVNLNTVLTDAGDLRAGRAVNDRSYALGTESGTPTDLEWDMVERGLHCYFAGEWSEARELLGRFLGGAGAEGHYMETVARDVRSRMRRAGGDIEGAVADAAWQLDRARDIGDPQVLFPALALSADTLAAAGRLDEVGPLADELLAYWRAAGSPSGVAAPVDLAWAMSAIGRQEDMLELLREVEVRSRWTTAAAAILRRELVAAAEELEDMGSLPDAARARLRAAERLLEQRRPSEAQTQVSRAAAFFRSVGATGSLRECAELEAVRSAHGA
jgi:hypothetical protein